MHTEMKLSKFGNKVAKTSGISLLMDDLGLIRLLMVYEEKYAL